MSDILPLLRPRTTPAQITEPGGSAPSGPDLSDLSTDDLDGLGVGFLTSQTCTVGVMLGLSHRLAVSGASQTFVCTQVSWRSC